MTAFPRPARRALAVAALPCAALLAACGSSTPSANPGPTVTVTQSAPPPSATPTSAAPTPVPVTSSAAPAGPQPCPTRSLHISLGLSQGALGSIYQVIDFTNISSVSCTLYGYPGVALDGGSPVAIIGAPAAENPATPRELITLAPGAVANALLRLEQAGDFPASRCAPVQATYIQVIPPNQTTPTFVQYSTQACSKPVKTMTVDVVKPGSGG